MSEAHVIALSGGKDSTAMALRLAEVEPRDYTYFCTPTGNELPEVAEHLARLEGLLGKPIERTTYVGIRADEPAREGGDYGPTVIYDAPLQRWGWGIGEVMGYLQRRGVCVPRRTDCIDCYDQRLIEWRWLYDEHPDLYWQGAAKEAETGHTFRSPGRDTWPASLVDLAREFEAGRKIRGADKYAERVNSCAVCRR